MRLLGGGCVEFTKVHPLFDTLVSFLLLGASKKLIEIIDFQRLSLKTLLINFVSGENLVKGRIPKLSLVINHGVKESKRDVFLD